MPACLPLSLGGDSVARKAAVKKAKKDCAAYRIRKRNTTRIDRPFTVIKSRSIRIKLWKIERIPTSMTSQAVLLFIFVNRKTIQSIQNDVMFVGIRSIFRSLIRNEIFFIGTRFKASFEPGPGVHLRRNLATYFTAR